MKTKLIVVAGPTAVGKTALGIELAKRFNGEIISGDSQQVYRQLNIGTAKATPEEQAAAVHHLMRRVKQHLKQTAPRKVTALLRRIAVLQKKAILKRAVRRIKKVYIKHEVLKKESASHNQQILSFCII